MNGKLPEHFARQQGLVPGFVGSDEDFDDYRARAAREKAQAEQVEAEALAAAPPAPFVPRQP